MDDPDRVLAELRAAADRAEADVDWRRSRWTDDSPGRTRCPRPADVLPRVSDWFAE